MSIGIDPDIDGSEWRKKWREWESGNRFRYELNQKNRNRVDDVTSKIRSRLFGRLRG